jgi:PEP-CTERM motif
MGSILRFGHRSLIVFWRAFMKKLTTLGVLLVATTSAFAQDMNATATQIWQGAIGTKANTGFGVQEDASYSNITTFSGLAFSNAGATSTITNLVADDLLTLTPNTAIESFTFSVSNLDTATFTARARVRFYADNGSGAPGTILNGFSFNPISFTAGSVGLFTANIAVGTIVVPADGKIWAGITFDNASGSTATTANLNNLGQGLFNAPTVGSSADVFFQTNVPGSHLANNPPGGNFNFSGAPVANYGWALTAVPEPASFAVIGLGLLGLVARRRKSSK